MIRQGRVTVNGKPALLGRRVLLTRDVVRVDGARIHAPYGKLYLMLNKPAGVVTTSRDPERRTTVLDLVGVGERVFPVGRLDAATEGLLLLTNDGELAHRLTHPSFLVPKTYVAEVAGRVEGRSLRRLEQGVEIEAGRPARAIRARVVTARRGMTGASVVEITIAEGRKHVVRKMLEAVGHPTRRLVRTAVGPIHLGRLAVGTYRNLTREEVGTLRRAVGLS